MRKIEEKYDFTIFTQSFLQMIAAKSSEKFCFWDVAALKALVWAKLWEKNDKVNRLTLPEVFFAYVYEHKRIDFITIKQNGQGQW